MGGSTSARVSTTRRGFLKTNVQQAQAFGNTLASQTQPFELRQTAATIVDGELESVDGQAPTPGQEASQFQAESFADEDLVQRLRSFFGARAEEIGRRRAQPGQRVQSIISRG